MHQKLLILGSVSGFIAIILGAFGSHGLAQLINEKSINTFEVGVRYQFYHALFALLLGSFKFLTTKAKNILFYLLLSGTILFSGSIYFLSTNALSSFDFKTIGFLTPIGGFLLIFAWFLLIVKVAKLKKK
ncbi:DUF423 domain-containing protein [Mesonia maritima]|uniref:Uncharacterized membrane protein YgdD (TMEM256/DUF423 family) n=1 Tax=Mesonia maritima TaxID=1793873 RepID=A0ABU1K1I2_9FLAO|nr:DUF423 domain-containing protein [Mesonia maritima]MDR6299460.1 uncharacterized membrane protein YgdD (TMEM256/DUF423 family) [Mesonia maritima]